MGGWVAAVAVGRAMAVGAAAVGAAVGRGAAGVWRQAVRRRRAARRVIRFIGKKRLTQSRQDARSPSMISRKDAKNAKLRILSLAFFASLREDSFFYSAGSQLCQTASLAASQSRAASSAVLPSSSTAATMAICSSVA